MNLSGKFPFWVPDPGSPLTPLENLLSMVAQSIADTLSGYQLPISVSGSAERNNKFPSPVTGDKVYRSDLGYTEVYYPAGFFVTGASAGWQPEGGDTGNMNISPNGGWSIVSGTNPLTVRVIGSMVTMNGRLSATTGATGSAFTLPVGARPSMTRVHSISMGGTTGVQAVQIGSDGNVFFPDLSLPANDYRLASVSPWMKA